MNSLLSEHSRELLKENNCFDFIRYFFTISVFIGHFCVLNNIEYFWFINGETGVRAFFIISGFLIFYSHIEKQSIKYYIDKRVRRILPPYFSVVILSFIIGIFITKLNLKDYLTYTETYKYLIANLAFLNFIQPNLPGVFESNPITAVNGSLWTMKVEIMFYVSVPFIYYLFKKYNKLIIILAIFSLAIAYDYFFMSLYKQTDNQMYLLIRKQFGSQLIYFYSGTFVLLYFDYFIKYLKFIFPAAIVIFLFRDTNFILSCLSPLAFAAILIGIAYNFKYMNFLRRYDNISYGMYLYHYPIIQIIIYYKIAEQNIYISFCLALISTIVVSWLSWIWLEKPIITKKLFYKRVPRNSDCLL